jgi:hypothetical protein
MAGFADGLKAMPSCGKMGGNYFFAKCKAALTLLVERANLFKTAH